MTVDAPAALREAAQILRAQGPLLATGNFEEGTWDADGRYRVAVCMQGAINRAVSGYAHIFYAPYSGVDSYDVSVALASTLPERCSEHGRVSRHGFDMNRIYHFNDEHCDGGVQAAEVLEQAAEKYEANR